MAMHTGGNFNALNLSSYLLFRPPPPPFLYKHLSLPQLLLELTTSPPLIPIFSSFSPGIARNNRMDCSSGDENQCTLLAELRTMVLQIEAGLDDPSSIEFCKSLTPKMMFLIERSICMAKNSSFADGVQIDSPPPIIPELGRESPQPSEASSPTAADRKEMLKKRKTLPKWTNQVRIGVGAGGIEGPIDDGYSWRKYGQKDIHGAKYPRGYYRCTHRPTQGCLATKQVQRSDVDPLAFDVTYHGTHTCMQQPRLLQASPPQELLSFQPGYEVKFEEKTPPLSFSFGSMPVTQHIFPSACTSENGFSSGPCPTFFSPATTSESSLNYVSAVSPCRVSSGFEGLHRLHTSESDLADIMSANNSATASPAIDLGLLEPLDFSDFQFDDPSFFS